MRVVTERECATVHCRRSGLQPRRQHGFPATRGRRPAGSVGGNRTEHVPSSRRRDIPHRVDASGRPRSPDRLSSAVDAETTDVTPATESEGLRLFGVPVYVDAAGRETLFAPERRFQLLAHLACRRRWLRRDELAELFWPERDSGSARSNLRKVLLLARQLPGLPPLEHQGGLLRWQPPSDLERFERAVAEGRHADALAEVHAPLLQGLDDGLAPPALQWLDFERQRSARLWRAAASERLAALREAPDEAAALAQRLLAVEPDDETVLLALCTALAALGRPGEAIDALRQQAARLAEDAGLEPSGALRRMAEQLRTAAAAVGSPRTASAAVRPPTVRSQAASGRGAAADAHGNAAASGLIGRRSELAQIGRLLAQDDCRWLTVTGPPGVGKSALARSALAALAGRFAQGGAWVPLDDLVDAATVVQRLASVLGIEADSGAPTWATVQAALHVDQRLIVLDNAEHLDLAQPLAELVAACPALRLLVTSRSRLGDPVEWLLPLDGLPLPDDDETDIEVLRLCDAVRLFEARALQRSPGFELARAVAPVVRLVHVVEGLPLAIELAAAWTRVLPVREIVAELALSLDLLEPAVDHSREKGLQAAFAQSWRLLTPLERTSLARLACLPAAFDRELAQQVAGAGLAVLAALVDKSLLRAESDGRFSMHALLRQCAATFVDDAPALAQRHARHVAQRFVRYGEMAQMPLAEVEKELPHLRAAWRWTLAQRDGAALLALAPTLDIFCQQRGLWREGLTAFEQAVAAFDDGSPRHDRPLQLALRTFTNMLFYASRLAEAEAVGRRSLKLAQRLGDAPAIMIALNALGSILCQTGRPALARPFFEQSRKRAVRDADLRREAIVVSNMAVVDEAIGDYERALAEYRRSIELHRAAGRMSGLAISLSNLANLLRLLDRGREALPMLHESLAVCDAHGVDTTRAVVLSTLGLAHLDLGDAQSAGGWLDRALVEARAHGEPFVEVSTLLGQARHRAAAGDLRGARSKADAALDVAVRMRSVRPQIEALLGIGEILVHAGHRSAGGTLLHWGLAQPGTYRSNVDAMRRRVAALDLEAASPGHAARLLPLDAPLDAALAFAAALPAPAADRLIG